MANVLLVGSNSFIARSLRSAAQHNYRFVCANRNPREGALYVDFEKPDTVDSFRIDSQVDGVLFCQGLNPTKNLSESSYGHFQRMMEVNVSGPAFLLRRIAPRINAGALILFFTSIAAAKGSYDPAYASAKSALRGLLASLSNHYPQWRFNSISLGLVENSPVYDNMTADFREKHRNQMFGNRLVQPGNVTSLVLELLRNENISRAEIALDGGYRL